MKQLAFFLCLVLMGCSQGNSLLETEPPPNKSFLANSKADQAANFNSNKNNSTPTKTVKNFFEAVLEGDVEQARSTLVMNQKVEEYLNANIDLVRAMDEFAEMDNRFFGEGGMPIGLMRRSMMSKLEKIETVVVNDNHVQCMVSPPKPFDLVKLSDGWKIDLTGKSAEQLLKLAPPTFRDTVQMLDRVRQGVEDGEITSRSEARKEISRLKVELGL
jgi:hypothetical protein